MNVSKLLALIGCLIPVMAWGQTTPRVTGTVVKNGVVQHTTDQGTYLPFPIGSATQPGVLSLGATTGTAADGGATCFLGNCTFTAAPVLPNLTSQIVFPNSAGNLSLGFTANSDELALTANSSGDNVFSIAQQNANGFAAETLRGLDSYFSGLFEHRACGYGAGLVFNGQSGFDFCENSRYTTTNNNLIPPSRYIEQQTGAEFSGIPYYLTVTFTAGSTTASSTSNPGSYLNGYLMTSYQSEGYVQPGTTVVSATGVANFTISLPALKSGTITIETGPTYYCQDNYYEATEMGSLNWYNLFQGCGNAPGTPAMTFERYHGWLGLGTVQPIAALDIVGHGWFGSDTTGSRSSNAYGFPDGSVNIDDPGVTGLKWSKTGINTLLEQWQASPNQIQMIDANSGKPVIAWNMDGSLLFTAYGASTLTGLVTASAGITSTAGPNTLGATTATTLGVTGTETHAGTETHSGAITTGAGLTTIGAGGLTSTAGQTSLGATTATSLTVSGTNIVGGFISLTGNQTLTASQCGQTLKSTDTAAVVYTVPAALTVGCKIAVVQDGVSASSAIGNVTIVGATGETIKNFGGTVTAGQYAGLLIKADTTSSAYVLTGN